MPGGGPGAEIVQSKCDKNVRGRRPHIFFTFYRAISGPRPPPDTVFGQLYFQSFAVYFKKLRRPGIVVFWGFWRPRRPQKPSQKMVFGATGGRPNPKHLRFPAGPKTMYPNPGMDNCPGIRISFGPLNFDPGEGLGGSCGVVFVDFWWICLVFGGPFWPY